MTEFFLGENTTSARCIKLRNPYVESIVKCRSLCVRTIKYTFAKAMKYYRFTAAVQFIHLPLDHVCKNNSLTFYFFREQILSCIHDCRVYSENQVPDLKVSVPHGSCFMPELQNFLHSEYSWLLPYPDHPKHYCTRCFLCTRGNYVPGLFSCFFIQQANH